MLEQTKRISFRISSVLSKVEPEPDLHTGSGSNQKVPAPAPQHWVWTVEQYFLLDKNPVILVFVPPSSLQFRLCSMFYRQNTRH